MRVLYDLRYATDHFPGIGSHAYRLARALLERDDPTRWTMLWNPGLQNSRFDVEPIRRHPRVEWRECALRPATALEPWRLGAAVRAVHPDVYFSPFYVMPASPGCPCVLTLHDVLPLEPWAPFPPPARWLFALAMRRAAGARFVVASSAFGRSAILARTPILRERLRVVPPGAVPVSAHPAPPANRPREPFALVIGINKPHKNLPLLVETWARLGDPPPLTLAGAGPADPRYPDLGSLARRRGVTGVAVLGHVREEELAWLYEHATLVLFPTRHEGFGFPLIEAMTHGAAVLASDIPPLRELGGEAAIWLPPDDAGAWANAVRHLLEDDARRESLQRAARARAAELDYGRTASAIAALLQEAAA